MKFNRSIFACLALIALISMEYALTGTAMRQSEKRAAAKPKITYLKRVDTPVTGVRIVSTEMTEAGGISITLKNVSSKPVSFASLFFWERGGVTNALPLPFYNRESGALEPGETFTRTFGDPDVPTLAAIVYSDGTVEGGGRILEKAVFFHNTYLNAQERYAETIKAGRAKGKSAEQIAGDLRSQAAREQVDEATRSTGALQLAHETSFALSERSGNEPSETKIERLRRKFENIKGRTLRTQEERGQQ